jgi:hypothetical protein
MEGSPNKRTPPPLKASWMEVVLHRVGVLSTLRERSRIRRICQESMNSYRKISAETPESSELTRYAQVIQRETGADANTVQRAIRRAEESFASWPVERPVKFRDIVQYLAVTDSLRIDIAVAGVDSRFVDKSLKIVTKMIPDTI